MMTRTRFLCLVALLALFSNLTAYSLASDYLFGNDSETPFDLSTYLEERLELSSILFNTLTDAPLDSDGSVVDFALRINKEIQLDELLFFSPQKLSSAQKTISMTYLQNAQGHNKQETILWSGHTMDSYSLLDGGDGILSMSSAYINRILEPGVYSLRISGQKFGFNEDDQLAFAVLGSVPSGRSNTEIIEYLNPDQLDEVASQGRDEQDDLGDPYYDSLAVYESQKPSFTSFNLISDPSHLYGDINSHNCDTIYIDFRADGTLTLGDIYFGIPYRYEDIKGTSIRLERFREDENISMARFIPAETIATVPASLFLGETPPILEERLAGDPADAVLSNNWAHVLGASFDNLVLEDGVYRITLQPRGKAVDILAGGGFYGLIATGEGRLYQLDHDEIDLLSGNQIHLASQIIGSEQGMSYQESLTAAEAAILAEAERIAPAFMEEFNQQLQETARQEQQAAAAKANQPIKLIIDGVTLSFGADQAPVIIDGRTLVPMRAVVEQLGYTVAWDSTNKIMDVYDTNTEAWLISMTIGSKVAKVGTKVSWVMDDRILDVAPQIINNRTMIPVRFVGETLGCDVKWNADTRTITIIS